MKVNGQIQVERIYSGFLGYPFVVCLWSNGKLLAWSTEDIKDTTMEQKLKEQTSMTDYSDPKIVALLTPPKVDK